MQQLWKLHWANALPSPQYNRLPHLQPCRSAAINTAASSSMTTQPVHPLWQKVLGVYDRAQQTGAATKTDTKIQLFEDGGVTYVLRVASALKAKPKGLSGSSGSGSSVNKQQQPPAAVRNPFLPYEEELWVNHLSDTHTLLLNKFNVVPHHVLVVTRQFESQQDPLNSRDLAATQQVLAAMPIGGVAFYNCGEHSGRSQPHKHLQVVPLPFAECRHSTCSNAEAPVEPLVYAAQAAAAAAPLQPFEVRQLPFRAYAVVLMPSTTAHELEAAANQLLCLGCAGLPAPVSYNVVLTRNFLLMVPRRQETCGRLAINSLGFAGTILLRSDDDLEFAQQQGPLNILAAVGQPWEAAAASL